MAALFLSHFRTYHDDADQNNENAYAGEDVAIKFFSGQNIILRIQQYSTTSSGSQTMLLQYSKNGGAYTSVPTSAGGDLQIVASPFFSNGASATQRLSSSAPSYNNGYAMSTANPTPTINTSVAFWECVWCLQFNPSAIGSYYTFKMLVGATSPTLTVTPKITIVPNNGFFTVI